MTDSLYIHIPFCEAICSYCDFCKVYYQKDTVDQYLKVLKRELSELPISMPLRTIYIGGGTPSSLSYRQLQYLMEMILPYIGDATKEVSIEVNPESMDIKKLEILKFSKINRLSIGVQTFNEEILSKLERKHSNKQVVSLISNAKQMGFKNISVDLMYGLPNQTLQDVKADLNQIVRLDVQHISYYSLILEEHTKLKNRGYLAMDEQLESKMQNLIDVTLSKHNYQQYEISNYAKEGYPSKHNLVYWRYENYYGIGIGAAGKIDNQMIEHSRNIYAYIDGQKTKTTIKLTDEDNLFNNIMMSLRLLEGIEIKRINEQYKVDFESKYQEVIAKYRKLGWLHKTNGRLHCDSQSLRFLNTILIDFLE